MAREDGRPCAASGSWPAVAGAPGVAIATVVDGAPGEPIAAGVADAASGAPVTPSTTFLWFSMTKIATATAVMRLVEAGRLELDAPVAGVLPDLPGVPATVTPRHLLSHTAGLPNPVPLRWIHPAADPPPDPRAMLGRLLRRHRRRGPVGQAVAYSNIGYLVLGELVARAAGTPYERFVLEEVLRPIGAARTAFAHMDPAAAARGHHPRRDPMLPALRLLLPRWSLGPAAGPWRLLAPFYLDGASYGGLVGPVGEAALLAGTHLGGGVAPNGVRLLSAESAAEMRRIDHRGKRFDVGLGWFRRHRDSERGLEHVEHLGGGGGFGAVMRLEPGTGRAVVAMGNVSSSRFRHERVLEVLAAGGRS